MLKNLQIKKCDKPFVVQMMGYGKELVQEIGAGTKCYSNGGKIPGYHALPPLCVGYGIYSGIKG